MGLLLLVYLAALAYALATWLPTAVSAYEQMAARHPWLGYLYLAAVGLGAAVLVSLTLVILYRIWRATAAKRALQRRRGKNPSELSAFDRAAELAQNVKASEDLLASPETSEELKEELRRQLRDLSTKQDAQQLEIVGDLVG